MYQSFLDQQHRLELEQLQGPDRSKGRLAVSSYDFLENLQNKLQSKITAVNNKQDAEDLLRLKALSYFLECGQQYHQFLNKLKGDECLKLRVRQTLVRTETLEELLEVVTMGFNSHNLGKKGEEGFESRGSKRRRIRREYGGSSSSPDSHIDMSLKQLATKWHIPDVEEKND